VTDTAFHGTLRSAAESIAKDGFDITRSTVSRVNAMYALHRPLQRIVLVLAYMGFFWCLSACSWFGRSPDVSLNYSTRRMHNTGLCLHLCVDSIVHCQRFAFV
jgi:hypothetical protein